MRLVIALGGNALLQRGQPMQADVQRANVRQAALELAPLAAEHELVISHGNGPQVGLLALQGAAYEGVTPYPLDVLGAQTEGMIGYMIEQELGNLLPYEKPFATVLTMVQVDPDDPAFANPTKPIGPVYTAQQAAEIGRRTGWTMAADGPHWRRVVPSPLPVHIFEIRPIRWLLEHDCIVICAGGGGIPTMYRKDAHRVLEGAEVVIDKDRASALLACEVAADMLIMATDVDGVYLDWGKATARKIDVVTPSGVCRHDFATGSMGPKVEAACAFVQETGRPAAIGALGQLAGIVAGVAGTRFEPDGQRPAAPPHPRQ
jgi:carbamate kinase